ncbi:MAG: hypothetical protein AAGG01_02180 [Planctomycetota bacterium]
MGSDHFITARPTRAMLIALALAPSCALLQESPQPEAGDVLLPVERLTPLEADEDRPPVVGEGGRVFGLSGSYSYRDEEGGNQNERFAARATIEEFVADEHALGAYFLGQFTNTETDEDGREQLWAGLHYRYHLHLTERTSLYAGPTVGIAAFDDENISDSALAYGVSGGVRHWLTERAAFTIEPTYLRAEFDADAGGDTEEFLVLWGLAFSL